MLTNCPNTVFLSFSVQRQFQQARKDKFGKCLDEKVALRFDEQQWEGKGTAQNCLSIIHGKVRNSHFYQIGLFPADFLLKICSKSAVSREEPLTIVQCTDGASESGLYLLAEIVIRCMESNVVRQMPNSVI